MNNMGAVKGLVRIGDGTPTVNRNFLAHVPVLTYNIHMPVSNPAPAGGTSDLLTAQNKEETPTATSGDNATTGITMSVTPGNDSYVKVHVNGISYTVGDGVKTKDCYFSDDAGTTAKAIASIVSGDQLIWNGLVTGFDLETSDIINLGYTVTT